MTVNETQVTPSPYKDAVLDQIGQYGNIAQFISFAPDLSQRFSCILGQARNAVFASVEAACEQLLTAATHGSVNIRSFKPEAPKGHKLIPELRTVEAAAHAVRQRAAEGFFTIVNESIPVNDGGVSGVATRGVIEFAPAATPKCVDGPNVASLPARIGRHVLQTAYGFTPELGDYPDHRIEFSLHPIRCGIRRRHTILWEVESGGRDRRVQIGKWPNSFSRTVGDKAYGLMIANALGFRVPKTTVFGRVIAPFAFGCPTGNHEIWLRTCPAVPVPGKYPTIFGWRDPYTLMRDHDPGGTVLASIIAQESVEFLWSGASRTTEVSPVVQGVRGRGDRFMIAAQRKEAIPAEVHCAVAKVHNDLRTHLKSIKFEWVWDGHHVWVVQLHYKGKANSERVIYPGKPARWEIFDPSVFQPEHILDQLDLLISSIQNDSVGITVLGDVGALSHLGDRLERARIPSRISCREQSNEQHEYEQLDFNTAFSTQL